MKLFRRTLVKTKFRFISLIIFIFTSCCTPLISQFDATAYRDATSLKVDSLSVMSEATTPYKLHEKEVSTLEIKLAKAYEYVKGIPHNEISAQMWERILDPNKFLLGGFLERWKEKGSLSATFVKDEKKQVSEGFNKIICLEANKKEITRCQ